MTSGPGFHHLVSSGCSSDVLIYSLALTEPSFKNEFGSFGWVVFGLCGLLLLMHVQSARRNMWMSVIVAPPGWRQICDWSCCNWWFSKAEVAIYQDVFQMFPYKWWVSICCVLSSLFFFIKSYIRDPLIIRVSFSSCSVSTFFSLRKTGENIDVFSLQCVSAAVCIWCYAGGSCGFGAAACSRPRKVSGVWKRATCQLNCSGSTNAWKEQPRKPLHSRGARERDGPLGPPGNVTVINALNLP